MDCNEAPEHPKQRQYDLIFGLIFLAFGVYQMVELYIGVPYSKIKTIMGVFMLVLGIFKLYAYIRTRTIKN